MQVYLDAVMLLNFGVDLLLLIATNRIAGYPQAWGRQLLAAGLGALYAGACLLPGFWFLGNVFWRIIFLVLMGMLCFGFRLGAVRRMVLFVFLSMALGGFALGLGQKGFWGIVSSALGICLLCFFGFRGRAGETAYVPVRLSHNGKKMSLLALRDTGNTLCDPVTGESVLVASAEVGKAVLGLTRDQLSSPVETVASGVIPGLRLIPYRTVGQVTGFLLTAKLDSVEIGKRQGTGLVAFSPEKLDEEGTFQALTGGVM